MLWLSVIWSRLSLDLRDRGHVFLGNRCRRAPSACGLLEVVQLKEDSSGSLTHVFVQVAISRFSQRCQGVFGEQEFSLAL